MAKERALERKLELCGVRVEMIAEKILSEKEILQLVKKGDREA